MPDDGHLQAIQKAYDDALANMGAAQGIVGVIAQTNPFQAQLYQNAQAAYAATSNVADSALKVLQPVIGDPNAIAALLGQLDTANESMAQRAAALKAEAQAIQAFTASANAVLGILTAILPLIAG